MPSKIKGMDMKTQEAVKFVKSPAFQSLYTNNIQFGVTRFDLQIVFGKVEISRAADSADAVTELSSVTMTPAFAKAFLMDYTRIIAQYEKQYGEIEIAPDMEKNPPDVSVE